MNLRNAFGFTFLLIAFTTGNIACKLPSAASYTVTVNGISGTCSPTGPGCQVGTTTFVLRVIQ